MIEKKCFLYGMVILCTGISTGHNTGVPYQLGCSYTFLVPKQADNGCPEGAVDFDRADVDTLRAVVKNQQKQLAMLTQAVMRLQEELNTTSGPTKTDDISRNRDNITSGTNYVRWGRTVCPESAKLVYWGYSAGSHYTHNGGGSNYLCLDNNPQWPESTLEGFQSLGYLYGVEYQTMHGMDPALNDNDAPCAVCHVDGRGEQLMIPGNRTCPDNWTKEYEGILVADAHTHKRSTYVCLDSNPEVVVGRGPNTNGALFYATESTCTALPCPPYVSGNEIACVVCTL